MPGSQVKTRPISHTESNAMTQDTERLKAQLEWDYFYYPVTARGHSFGAVEGDLGLITVGRNPDCSLNVVMESSPLAAALVRQDAGGPAGELVYGHRILATGDGFQMELEGAFTDSGHTTVSRQGVRVVPRVSALSATWHSSEGGPTAMLVEWYVGGPRSSCFRRFTARNSLEFARTRPESTVPVVGALLEDGRGEEVRDHLVLKVGQDIRAIFAEVPSSFGPDWSANVCVEYPARDLPSNEVRAAIAEGIGVFFGRRLFSIGETSFDADGQALAASAWDPKGLMAVAVAQQHDARLFDGMPLTVEDELSPFLDRFLLHRDRLQLSSAIQTLRVADNMPVGPDLAIYGAALERIKSAWLKSSGRKLKTKYIERREFETLLKDELNAIKAKLDFQQDGGRIFQRISAAFQVPGGQQLADFLAEVPMTLSQSESGALKARNYAAHGSNGAGMEQGLSARNTYRTLINRVLLKLIGHDGKYTDYGSPSFTERDLDEPSGGTDG